jgi:hypothetical protein
MVTRRIPLQRHTRWRVSATALQIWRTILEIQAQPRDARGDLSEADYAAERAGVDALAAAMGFSRLTIEPHRVQDQPWNWITDNQVQMERWAEGKEIRDVLNRALMEETERLSKAAKQRRASRGHVSVATRAQEPEPKAP